MRPVPDRAAVDLRVDCQSATSHPASRRAAFHVLQASHGRDAATRDFPGCRTSPGPAYESVQAFAPNCRFHDLQRTPARKGGYLDATTFPLAVEAEDLIQLTGVEGRFDLDLHGDDCRVSLEWNRDHFPSVLLWISNQACTRLPGTASYMLPGIELVCSAFGLGLEGEKATSIPCGAVASRRSSNSAGRAISYPVPNFGSRQPCSLRPQRVRTDQMVDRRLRPCTGRS